MVIPFPPLHIGNLMARGLLSPPSEHGTQIIHKRLLHYLSDVAEYSDTPLTLTSLLSDDDATTTPINKISVTALKYVGFDDKTAVKMWNTWSTSTPDGRDKETENPSGSCDYYFAEFLIESLNKYEPEDHRDEDDKQWFSLMRKIGINRETQDAIMDPYFKDFRLYDTCVNWLKSTVKARYRVLETSQAESSKKAKELQGEGSGS